MFRVPNAVRERTKEKRHSYWRINYHGRSATTNCCFSFATAFSRRKAHVFKTGRLVSLLYCCVLANWDFYDCVSCEDIFPCHEYAGVEHFSKLRDS